MEINKIPESLKNIDNWVFCDNNKIPKQHKKNGSGIYMNALLDKPETWTDFANIIKHKNNFYGAGFVFQRNKKYIGLDLDKCFIDGGLTRQAEKIVDIFKSYTEKSVSGKGLHIIIEIDEEFKLQNSDNGYTEKFKMNDTSLDFKELEIITSNKYLLMTGEIFQYEKIENRTKEFNEFYKALRLQKLALKEGSRKPKTTTKKDFREDEILSKLLKSRNASKFKKLFYEGNKEDYSGDESSADLALCNLIAFYTNEFDLIDSLFCQSALYRQKWDREDYKKWTIEKALEGVRTFRNVNKSKKRSLLQFKKTDLANAERLIYEHGENIKFCSIWKAWYIWNSRYWEKDDTQAISRLAKKTIRDLEKEVVEIEDSEEKGLWRKFITKSESSSSLANMVKLSESELEVISRPEDYDNEEKTKYLLNLKNGILNLQTGELTPHQQRALITKYIDIEYNREAKRKNWEKFINGIFLDNKEIINYVQKAVGYSLSGDISEQCIFILEGTGSNGKSTFVETINHILNDYARPIPPESLTLQKNERIPEEIARLQGVRFTTSSESKEGARLNEALIKQMTGGEKLTARFLYSNSFDFSPQFKIFYSTNHKPRITGTDDGIWRRVKRIPFKAIYGDKEGLDERGRMIQLKDKDLPEKLKKEVEGILTWCIEGFVKWQKEGLIMPEELKKATEEYRSESDLIKTFLDESCVIQPSCKVSVKELYKTYCIYCDENSERVVSNRIFSQKMKEKGFDNKKGTGGRFFWEGIGLLDH